MIRIRLPPTEAERLDVPFRWTDDPKFRGRARQDIATDLGTHHKTVTRWINAYCDEGLGALRPKKAKGPAGKIPASLADEIRRWVTEGPGQLDARGTGRPSPQDPGRPHLLNA